MRVKRHELLVCSNNTILIFTHTDSRERDGIERQDKIGHKSLIRTGLVLSGDHL